MSKFVNFPKNAFFTNLTIYKTSESNKLRFELALGTILPTLENQQ